MGETSAEFPTIPCGGAVAALSISHFGGPFCPKLNSDYAYELEACTKRVIEFRVGSPLRFRTASCMILEIWCIYPLLVYLRVQRSDGKFNM